MDKEMEKTIQNLKDKIIDGRAMAHDPMCSEGFKAANQLIAQYEFDIKTLNEQLQLAKNYIKMSARDMGVFKVIFGTQC